MTYNFQNLAIKCETRQQMQHLAKIAEGQGYKSIMFKEEEGDCYFVAGSGMYSNYAPLFIGNLPTTTYTTFINSHPDVRVEGC